MGGTVPGVDAVTVYLPRERHVKGRMGKYWAFGPLTLCMASTLWSSTLQLDLPVLGPASALQWASHARFSL